MTGLDQDFGTLVGPRSLRVERLLPGSVEQVWAFLTKPEKRATWLAAGPMELRSGGRVDLVFHNDRLSQPGDRPPPKYAGYGDENILVCVVSECDPPRRLVMSWGEPGPDTSEVSFELEPEGGRTRLILTHSRLGTRDGMLLVSAGWHTHLELLAAQLEARPAPSFWARYIALEAQYDRRIPADPS